MIKRKSDMRHDPKEALRGGDGVTVFDHIMEKTELLGNCRIFCKATLEPGASIGYHQHDQEEEVYYILSGVATVNDNGQEVVLHPGDAHSAGNGGSHSIANHGEGLLEFLAVILTYQAPER